MGPKQRLTIVQYAGDFAEASKRLAAGGPETYRAQRHSVDYVESLAERFEAVTTVVGLTERRYDETLPSGARAIGAGYADKIDSRDFVSLVASTKPDLLILRTPLIPVLAWASAKRLRTLLLIADSFNETGLKGRLKQRVLTHFFNAANVEAIGNHGVSACEQLVRMGVRPAKVVPWDFPALDTPDANPAKAQSSASPNVIYVGALTEDKGVFELVDAIKLLADQGLRVSATLVGKPDEGRLQARIAEAGLADRISLAGLLPNSEIIPRMKLADLVVVPSRHSYPEGLPLTIYEALCSRTPLVVSDHPMFVKNVRHEESALVFEGGNARSLSEQIARLIGDPSLYGRLSGASAVAWRRLQLPMTWSGLIDAWLSSDRDRLSRYSMASYDYQNRPD